jgi:hypothetical protein
MSASARTSGPRTAVRAGAAIVLGAAMLATPAAQAAPKVGERIAITACPYRGVVATCLMIDGADGTVFNISGANPKPRLMGRMIWLRGTITDKASLCSQGTVLDRVRWTRLPQRCPN